MRSVDVAVVGAGPSGISAALAAADTGADTLLIDENQAAGGQLQWRLSPAMDRDLMAGIDAGPGPEVARQLAARLDGSPGLTVAAGTVAWGVFEQNVLGLSSDDGAEQVQAGAIVLATGSTDITLPFPGWTLPGVMTARAAQIFMHVHRVLPGRRWAILGDTAEGNELAEDVERAGGEVVARCDDPEQLRASGANRLSHVEYGSDVVEVDGLAIALGRQPDAGLALQALVAVDFVPDLGGYTPFRGDHCETSVPGIYVAGDAAGIGDLPEILAEGRIAGLAAAGADQKTIDQARKGLESCASERRREAISRVHLTKMPVA